MEQIYSNRIAQSYIQFLDKKFGKDVTDRILEKCQMDRLTLADPAAFHTNEETQRLTLTSMEVTGEKDLPYLAGRNLPQSLGRVGGFMIGITSPAFFMRTLGQIEGKLARKTINKTTPIGHNKYRVEISFKDNFKEGLFVCRNRVGTYESAPLFFGLPYARVEHPQCAHLGAEHCVYIINFPDFGFGIFSRLFQVLTLTSMLFAGFWLANTANLWLLAVTLFAAAGGSLSFAYYRHLSAKRSLEWSLLSNEGLAQQNKMLEATNVQMDSLLVLTTLLNNSIRVQDICDRMVKLLVVELRFGSSQIWLLDPKREYLACQSAVGYAKDLLAFITNTRFKMGENWDNPYGLLVQTLQERKTIIVNDPNELIPKLTGRTQEFLRALKMSSFIITPLIHEDKPLGILAAEYHRGEKIEHQDKLLFQSISNIVANALVKADLFEKMEQKVEQRGKELEAASRQLVTAKEMAIQSEKLSSLGQMAAGVAHEINNPLNFLVNIIPDVRRDMEALEKIRDFALAAGDAGLADKIKTLQDETDLESHLSEKDYVFEKIQKALDKSTRIANSLKVFSRSSTKETVSKESIAVMVKEVVDLIPQKNRGDTRFELDIPAELAWNVNKNEMEQVFLALTNNAIDAMGQKGKLEIKAVSRPGEIVISFKDEGPGIPEEALKKIFDPFYTTKPPGKGTGLGLTIASEIVRKYGGVLTAESEPGRGATFLVKLQRLSEKGDLPG